jgi:hypothetical protein
MVFRDGKNEILSPLDNIYLLKEFADIFLTWKN